MALIWQACQQPLALAMQPLGVLLLDARNYIPDPVITPGLPTRDRRSPGRCARTLAISVLTSPPTPSGKLPLLTLTPAVAPPRQKPGRKNAGGRSLHDQQVIPLSTGPVRKNQKDFHAILPDEILFGTIVDHEARRPL
jgi:hypothetical protein